MHWPQITYIVLLCITLGVTLAKDGEPRGEHNFVATLLGSVFVLWLLWAGGFFDGGAS